jgi:hypothetical protein
MSLKGKAIPILGLIILSACAPRKIIQPSTQRSTNWMDTLSIPPGSSLSDTDLQDIQIISVKEIREPDGKLWLAGKGYAKLNGGSSVWFWQSSTPPQVEIEITDLNQILTCKEVLEQSKASGKPVSLVGNGHFGGKQVNDNLVGIFQITHVNTCALLK